MISRALGGSLICIVLGSSANACRLWSEAVLNELSFDVASVVNLILFSVPSLTL